MGGGKSAGRPGGGAGRDIDDRPQGAAPALRSAVATPGARPNRGEPGEPGEPGAEDAGAGPGRQGRAGARDAPRTLVA
ncbi:hypothetical protein TPA0909_39820 [Streptomyces albus]|nr:hypothetical protein TPA0909_39820 [Streptomyces albus]